MPADNEDHPVLAPVDRKTTPAAALAALGIVYGDLGTSPLYTLNAVVGDALRDRAADATRLERDHRARRSLSGDDWRRSDVCRHGPHRPQSDPYLLVRDRVAGAAAQLCRAGRSLPRRSSNGR